MTLTRTALRTGAAAIAVAGFCGIAAAQTPQTHVLTVALPGGGIEQIRYTGATPPQVFVSDAPAPVFATLPTLFGAGSPFTELDRISAMMDRQAARMFEETAALSAQPTRVDPTTIAALPAGTHEYSFVSMTNGSGVCSRSVEITSAGNGAAPRVVTHASGDCPATGGFQLPTQGPAAPLPGSGPRMIMTKAAGAHPYAGRIEEAALR